MCECVLWKILSKFRLLNAGILIWKTCAESFIFLFILSHPYSLFLIGKTTIDNQVHTLYNTHCYLVQLSQISVVIRIMSKKVQREKLKENRKIKLGIWKMKNWKKTGEFNPFIFSPDLTSMCIRTHTRTHVCVHINCMFVHCNHIDR